MLWRRNRLIATSTLCCLFVASFTTVTPAQDLRSLVLSEAEIKQAIIAASTSAYPGNCPCPYNSASNGSACGRRSAWSRKGGYAPMCYEHEVTPEMILKWRRERGQQTR
jgi:hypothetical protein